MRTDVEEYRDLEASIAATQEELAKLQGIEPGDVECLARLAPGSAEVVRILANLVLMRGAQHAILEGMSPEKRRDDLGLPEPEDTEDTEDKAQNIRTSGFTVFRDGQRKRVRLVVEHYRWKSGGVGAHKKQRFHVRVTALDETGAGFSLAFVSINHAHMGYNECANTWKCERNSGFERMGHYPRDCTVRVRVQPGDALISYDVRA